MPPLTSYTPEPIVIGQDHIFGTSHSLQRRTLQLEGDWRGVLPIEEYQSPLFETFACISEVITSAEEALNKASGRLECNYSARFLAAASGTKEGGNSPKKVAYFARKVGFVPENLYPTLVAQSFDEFYQKLDPKLYEHARSYFKEKEFWFEYVPATPEAIFDALKLSPVGVSVHAWIPDGDHYILPDGIMPNHFTLLVYAKKNEYFIAFDSYPPYIKKLPWDYRFGSAQRYHISFPQEKQKTMSVWFNFIPQLKDFFFKRT